MSLKSHLDRRRPTFKDMKVAERRARIVPHGYGQARTIATGVGPVELARAKIRDRGATSDIAIVDGRALARSAVSEWYLRGRSGATFDSSHMKKNCDHKSAAASRALLTRVIVGTPIGPAIAFAGKINRRHSSN
ncbi:hypothetical protein RAD15_24000 [Bradyrhizobium sp. 14AA]